MVKISELPLLTSVATDDVVPINDVSVGDTKHTTLAHLAAAVAADPTLTSAYAGDGNSWTGLPRFARAVTNQNDSSPSTIRLIGLGSSVGAGATLANAAADAPSAYLAAQITAKLDVLSNIDLAHTNGSVGGTTLSACISGDDLDDAVTTAGGNAALVLLSFGMNDGNPSEYHSGQTYPQIARSLRRIIKQVRAFGGDAIVATTPHPNTDAFDFAYVGATTYPGSLVPDEAGSVVTIPWKSGTVDVSYRHLRVNQMMRRVAAEMGCAVIDAERYWFDALLTNSVGNLFDEAQTVHPNLLGHQLSYHAAIDDFVAALAERPMMVGRPHEPLMIVKQTDSVVNNTTTKADVSDFIFAATPHEVYFIEVDLFYNAATAADMEVQFNLGGAGGVFVWGLWSLGASATSTGNQQYVNGYGNQPQSNPLTLGGAGANAYARLVAVFTVGATGGSPKLTFSQKTADVSDATIYAGSVMRVTAETISSTMA